MLLAEGDDKVHGAKTHTINKIISITRIKMIYGIVGMEPQIFT